MNYKYNKMDELENALKEVYDQADPTVVKNWLTGIAETVNEKSNYVSGCVDCPFCHRQNVADNKMVPYCYWDGSKTNLIKYIVNKERPTSCPINTSKISIQKSED